MYQMMTGKIINKRYLSLFHAFCKGDNRFWDIDPAGEASLAKAVLLNIVFSSIAEYRISDTHQRLVRLTSFILQFAGKMYRIKKFPPFKN